MTKAFLKNKFTLKKRLWLETEVYTDSGNIKGDSTIIKIHPGHTRLFAVNQGHTRL